MIDSHADPSGVACQIIYSVRRRAPQFRYHEIVHPNLFRIPLWSPLPSSVLELSQQFLLLGVNRYHRLAEGDVAPNFVINVLELSIAVRVGVSFLGLPVGLQAVIQLMQQLRNHWIAHPMPHPVEILGQFADAVAGPAQAGLRVAARGGLHQFLQIRHQSRILVLGLLPPASRTADPSRRMRRGLRQLFQSKADHLARDTSGPGDFGDATRPTHLALYSGQQAARSLVQHRLQKPETLTDASRIIHPLQDNPKHSRVVMLFHNSFLDSAGCPCNEFAASRKGNRSSSPPRRDSRRSSNSTGSSMTFCWAGKPAPPKRSWRRPSI